MKTRLLPIMLLSLMLAGGCAEGWTSEERALIENQPAVMRVLTVEDDADLKVLRTPCRDLSMRELADPLYASLAAKLVATVTSPEQDGVGIAGPQVGLSRNVIAVQRFDKEGEPFEVYPNIRIVATRGEPEPGQEGCLSVPGRRGEVLRWHDIDICYTSTETGQEVTERVEGFTAVIFQHETDHLKGILYTDKTLAGSQDTKSQNTQEMNTNESLKEVAGRTNFGPNHALVTTPQPCVMIATWDKDHTPDVMMAAWAGQYDSNEIVISLSKHKTTANLEQTGAFTVSFADIHTVAESDYFGLVSGNDVPDKVAKVGFTVTPSPNVDAPIINEYPLTLECKVVSWEDGILVGKVVNMSAAERILTDGKVDLAKLQPIVFDAASMSYRAIGEIVGKAWGAGKVFTK